MGDRILDISNKVKKVRDNNPILDALAGFIPGVGEAQDFQDLTHAVRDNNYIEAGLYSLGLLLPGLSGGQIKKLGKAFIGKLGELSPALKKAGWKLVEDGESFIDPKGISFMRDKDNHLVSEEALAKRIKASPEYKKIIADKPDKKINTDFKKSIKDSQLNWNPDNVMAQRYTSQELIPTKDDLLQFKSRVPQYVELEKQLIQSGELIKSQSGKWYGKMGKNWHEVIPEQYVISKSKEFVDNGWVMSRKQYLTGMPDTKLAGWKNNTLGFQKWFAEDNPVAEGGNLAKSYVKGVTGFSGTGDTLGGHIAYQVVPGKTKNSVYEGYGKTWAELPYDKQGKYNIEEQISTRDLTSIDQAQKGNLVRTYFNNYEDGGVQWFPNSKKKRSMYRTDPSSGKVKKLRTPVTDDNVLVITPHTQLKLIGGNTGSFNPEHLGAFEKQGGILKEINYGKNSGKIFGLSNWGCSR